jgi:hypothetical protein
MHSPLLPGEDEFHDLVVAGSDPWSDSRRAGKLGRTYG